MAEGGGPFSGGGGPFSGGPTSGGPGSAAGSKNLQEALTVVSLSNICFKKCVVPQSHKLST